jgi:glyoxylase-like metal-dependent hydrolase (beta-lactamase superfamily II)
MIKPHVTAFFDEKTFTASYIVEDPSSDICAIIDPVLDYDPASGRTSHTSADELIQYIANNGQEVEWILETHLHADHLSAASYLKQQVGGQIGIGSKIVDVQSVFNSIFKPEDGFVPDGSQFDHLFEDNETFKVGNADCHALHTPGHTPACMSYVLGDTVFVGDTLFMPDYGTARADFPGGDARTLYRSIQKIFQLPPETRLFTCHDYKSPDRDEYRWESTVEEERASNIHVREGISEDEFVAMRDARDKTLSMPRLILPSVQVNMRGGELPPADVNGKRFLKIPINEF